jgi:cation diffusion facilitator CzcD-associated flavoprotein CzcO
VAGFPNCYLIHGPNIGLGHTSVIHMFESQANYIAAAIGYAHANGLAAIEPTPSAQALFTADLWPGTTFEYRRRTLRFDPTTHLMHRPAPAGLPVAA